MHKKVLSEQVLYYGDVKMPKDWDINPLNLCKQFFDCLYHEKDFHFCEAETLAGKPYCKEHCDVAYIDERELKKEKEAQKNRRIAA